MDKNNYLAIAPRADTVHDWCVKYGVHPRTVQYLHDMRGLRGRGTFSLIVFSGWPDNGARGYIDIGSYAIQRANYLFYPETHDPVVQAGVIWRWIAKEEKKEEKKDG